MEKLIKSLLKNGNNELEIIKMINHFQGIKITSTALQKIGYTKKEAVKKIVDANLKD